MAATKRILITRRLPDAVMARARATYDVLHDADDRQLGRDELVAACREVDGALICIRDKFDATVVDALPQRFGIVSTFSVGTDHIDLAAARERGLRVGCAPNGVTIATAEIAMLLILGAARRAGEGERMMRDASWTGWEPLQLVGCRLDGKRLGIVGMGKIGKALAQRARGFDMELHYYNRRPLPAEEAMGATYHASLESLLAVSDVLSLNAPSTPQTRGMLDAAALARLPRGAIVVNTARGDLVVDEDLIVALRSGQVGYAGLDVYAGEPNLDPRYRDLPNTFLLPHLGSAAIEARNQMGFEALDNIDAFFAGRELPFPVV
ncbi:MAG: D-glycerate dehydrogenase [Rhizobiales bacterium]|nr:D-glycerate dehydrogenase [Hyphomicrobiales bacterium]